MEHLLAVLAGSAVSSFLNWITTKLQTSQLASQVKDLDHKVSTQSVVLPAQIAKDVSQAMQATPAAAPTDTKV